MVPTNDARNDFQRQDHVSNETTTPLLNFTAIYCVFDTIEQKIKQNMTAG